MTCRGCPERNWQSCAAGKYELSGGEQQRVSTTRALVTSPEVVFADEPTGELDTTARSITAILREISANGATVIAATHDLSLAAAGDRRLEMVDGSLIVSG